MYSRSGKICRYPVLGGNAYWKKSEKISARRVRMCCSKEQLSPYDMCLHLGLHFTTSVMICSNNTNNVPA